MPTPAKRTGQTGLVDRHGHLCLWFLHMIGYIHGKLLHVEGNEILVDVNGLGYELSIPDSSLAKLGKEGDEITLFTHLVSKEDSLILYGFESLEEKAAFRLLLEVSGVGPRLALALLSRLSPAQLLQALATGEISRLQAVKGVGRKTAARLHVDLKEKARELLSKKGITQHVRPTELAEAPESSIWSDALSALMNLGYHQNEAESALERLGHSSDGHDVEMLIKEALKLLSSRGRNASR